MGRFNTSVLSVIVLGFDDDGGDDDNDDDRDTVQQHKCSGPIFSEIMHST